MDSLGDAGADAWEVASRRAGVIAGQAAQLNADLVDLMVEVLETDCWSGGGIRSPEHWLQLMTAISPSRAADIVAVARRKGDFPELEARLARGTVSLDQLVVVARHVPTEYAESVTEFVEAATVSQLRRVLPKYLFEPGTPGPVEDPPDPVAPVDDAPTLRMGLRDGRFVLRFDANPLDGALVEQAVREAKDALFTAGDTDATLADGLVECASRSLHQATPSSRREHYRVLVHLDADGNGWLNKRGSLPSRLMQNLTCDGTLKPVWTKDAKPVSVGRSMRIVPERTRRLIEDRDGGCRYPGCTVSGFLENHHLYHWSKGGATDMDTLISLCSRHHREHHQGEFSIEGDPGVPTGLRFTNRYGLPIERDIPDEIPPVDHPPPEKQPIRGWIMETTSINFRPTPDTG